MSDEIKTPAQRYAAMCWSQRLKRVFKIDIKTYNHCDSAILIYRESGHSVLAVDPEQTMASLQCC